MLLLEWYEKRRRQDKIEKVCIMVNFRRVYSCTQSTPGFGFCCGASSCERLKLDRIFCANGGGGKKLRLCQRAKWETGKSVETGSVKKMVVASSLDEKKKYLRKSPNPR